MREKKESISKVAATTTEMLSIQMDVNTHIAIEVYHILYEKAIRNENNH